MIEGRIVVCYGIGKNFNSYISRLDTVIKVDCFCDGNIKLHGLDLLHDGRICISPDELASINDPIVIITADSTSSISQIEEHMKTLGIECHKVREFLNTIDYKVDHKWIDRMQARRIHKFIDLNLHGTTVCNFHCDYCYVWRRFGFNGTRELSSHSVKEIRQGLSLKNTGGICFINMCARGETLLSNDIVELTYELLEEGHYVSIVTNGTITNKINEILEFPENMLERLFFKLSFHYLELEKRNLFEVFWNNVESIKHSKCSYTLEITPCDGAVSKIPEIKNMFKEQADDLMPHISYARDSTKKAYDVLTEYSIDEYNKIWSQFDSKMFDLKSRHYGEKITDYCHAGEWSYLVSILTGDIKPCYGQEVIGNIYDKDFDGFPRKPVGCNCCMDYCINNHAFLAWGTVPQIDDYTYLDMRDRENGQGVQWVKKPMAEFMSDKLYSTNYVYEDNWSDYNKIFNKREKATIFIFNSPDYCNAGDHAIAIGERNFIKENFPEYDCIEISCEQYQKEKYKLLGVIEKDDIVAITGGGNLGTLWIRFEDYILDIINTFKDNSILVFPQSIYFSNDDNGKKEIKAFKEIVNKHGNVRIAVRDTKSYEFLGKEFDSNIIKYVPDMAFYIKPDYEQKSREGILICARQDKECSGYIENIILDIKEQNLSMTVIEHLPMKSVKLGDRVDSVNEAISLLASKELVVTDRLHCMILCYLVKTPCIFVDNISNKLDGTYQWIKETNYIKKYDEEKQIKEQIEELLSLDERINVDLNAEFENYADFIREELGI